ncbi:hypothetical protein FV219_00300 [Methylobacterium sp. WL122]|nr:hypothetical protein FV219_00300 [Methylobacterium sp. WL122]
MADTPLCFPCSVGAHHSCPICGEIVAGDGQAPCYPCGQRRRSEAQITHDAETIELPWLAELFTGFCRSGRIPLANSRATRRIVRAASACREIAFYVRIPSDLTTDMLHMAIGAEGLRRVAPLIAYLAEVGALQWERGRLQVLVEHDRVATILERHRYGPHGPLLQRYRDHLDAKGRKPITQRTALTAAVALLATLKDAPLADLSPRHLARMLRKTPGHRAAIQGFLSFLAAEGGPKLGLRPAARPDAVALERKLRAEIRTCRKRLANARNHAEARALLAALIARVYGLPLSRVLAIRRDEVAVTDNTVTFWPDGDALGLAEPLAHAFYQWIAWSGLWQSFGGPFVFPGRHRHQPLSEAAVAYHLSDKI